MKKLNPRPGILAVAVLAYAASALAADPYREYVWDAANNPPSVEGDKNHTDTYQYWKDRSKLPAMSGVDEWQLNWKFRDRPGNDQLHGGDLAQERGELVYKKLNTGNAFAACMGAPDGNLKGLRLKYPRYDEDMKKIVGMEARIEYCSSKLGSKLVNGSYDNSAVSIYIAAFSNGMPMAIDVSQGPLKESFERGRKAFNLKAGRMNLACASCHVQMVGRNLRGQTPTTHFGDLTHWPTWRGKDELQSLHVRFTECDKNSGVQPLQIGSQSYTDIEVYLSALSNGYPMQSPSMRD
ncbi:MAG: sulfur oxidation c-type cytochrome SoxA [Thiobacillus sp.]